MSNLLIATNNQKVLNFLSQRPGSHFLAGEIQKKLRISKGGVNLSLRELSKKGFINREKKGKVFLYSINHNNPIIKQLKVLINIEMLTSLINKMRGLSKKIILFGSSARGEDSIESDIDLFILTNSPTEINNIIKKYKISRKLQFIIRTPNIFTNMEQKEPVFFEEIKRGIVLWESKE